ncbi:hypothetical protein POM88_026861 [Heracleum sosnowskyi]|uniref:PCI domain-containing protein n=1 Tax=Heracleum sosnowskyi TaxID=360622 RepID=A0AAD8MPD1_9APIA|nr:hypothetical protein POM88_026861 [Heracleum sosnowskyi]
MADRTRSKVATVDEKLGTNELKIKEVHELLIQNRDGVNMRFGTMDARLEKVEHNLEEIRLLLVGLQPPKSVGNSVLTQIEGASHGEFTDVGSTNHSQPPPGFSSGTPTTLPCSMLFTSPHTVIPTSTFSTNPVTQLTSTGLSNIGGSQAPPYATYVYSPPLDVLSDSGFITREEIQVESRVLTDAGRSAGSVVPLAKEGMHIDDVTALKDLADKEFITSQICKGYYVKQGPNFVRKRSKSDLNQDNIFSELATLDPDSEEYFLASICLIVQIQWVDMFVGIDPQVSGSKINRLYSKPRAYILNDRWFDVTYLMLDSANSIFFKVSIEDLLSIFTVICKLVKKTENPCNLDNEMKMVNVPSQKATQELNILRTLFDVFQTRHHQIIVFEQLKSVAAFGWEFTECVVMVFKNIKMEISIEDRRNFFLSMSSLLKESGRSTKDSLIFLSKYLDTFCYENALNITELKKVVVQAIFEVIQTLGVFTCELHDMPVVAQLDEDAEYGLVYQLLKIFLTQEIYPYMAFYEKNSEVLIKHGLVHEDCVKKMKLLLLVEQCDLTDPTFHVIPYCQIAESLQIDEPEVETWVNMAITADLLDCDVDSIEKTITVRERKTRVSDISKWPDISTKLVAETLKSVFAFRAIYFSFENIVLRANLAQNGSLIRMNRYVKNEFLTNASGIGGELNAYNIQGPCILTQPVIEDMLGRPLNFCKNEYKNDQLLHLLVNQGVVKLVVGNELVVVLAVKRVLQQGEIDVSVGRHENADAYSAVVGSVLKLQGNVVAHVKWDVNSGKAGTKGSTLAGKQKIVLSRPKQNYSARSGCSNRASGDIRIHEHGSN